MSDQKLRRIEREAASGDPQATARLVRERRRAGVAPTEDRRWGTLALRFRSFRQDGNIRDVPDSAVLRTIRGAR